MSSWVVETAFSTAMLACLLLGWMLWRWRKVRLSEKERKWREAQLAQLESLKERMQDMTDLVAADSTDLPVAPSGRVA